MMDEIEELWSLADECREWAKAVEPPLGPGDKSLSRPAWSNMTAEFERLARRLDAIAKDLAARLPT